MRRLASLILVWMIAVLPVVAQSTTGTIPNGFPQDFPSNVDGNATVLTVTHPATGTYLNHRILTTNATTGITFTDGGSGGNFTLQLSTIPIANGGTGSGTAQGGFNNLADGTAGAAAASGDVLYRAATNWTRLAKAADGTYLSLVSGLPSWVTPPAGPSTSVPFLTLALDASISAERVLTAGSGIGFTDLGANSTLTVAVDSTVVRTTGAQSVGGVKTFTNDLTIASGVNEIRKGTTFDITLTRTDPAAARSYNLPDVGGAADFLMTAGAQTITGNKTFGSGNLVAPNIVNTGTLTLPTSTDTLVGRATTDTLTNKTLTTPAFTASSLTLQQATANYVLNWNNPGSAGTRNYYVTDVGTSADIVMLNHNDVYTNGGVFWANGSTAKITASGSTGNPLVSTGAGAPAFSLLGAAGGGTGAATVPAKGSILVGNAGGTAYINLGVGADGTVLQADSAQTNGVKWGTAAGSVTSFSSGSLSPLFTTSVATATTTPALSFSLTNAGAYTVFGNNTGSSAAPAYQSLVSQQLPQSTAFGVGGASPGIRPLLNVPTLNAVTNSGATGSTTYTYVVVAREYNGTAEDNTNPFSTVTAASATASTATGNATLSGSNFNIISWTAVPGAKSYSVFRTVGGTNQGYVGSTTSTTFNDQSPTVADAAYTAPSSTRFGGIYSHTGSFTTDSNIICNNCLLNVDGNFTLSAGNAITSTNGFTPQGGLGAAPLTGAAAGNGGGLGGGNTGGGGNGSNNTIGGAGAGGPGAVYSVSGGNGGGATANLVSQGGASYSWEQSLLGSGGGGGQSGSSSGGGGGSAGGDGFALNCTGNVIISGSITMSATNALPATVTLTGAGGGGSGGGIDIRALGSVTLSAGSSLISKGGNGGSNTASSTAAGGGGAGGAVLVHGSTVTNSGATITVTGGAAGTQTGGAAATGGYTGVSKIEPIVWAPRQRL